MRVYTTGDQYYATLDGARKALISHGWELHQPIDEESGSKEVYRKPAVSGGEGYEWYQVEERRTYIGWIDVIE